MKCYAQSVQEALEITIVNRFWRAEKGLFGAQNGTFGDFSKRAFDVNQKDDPSVWKP